MLKLEESHFIAKEIQFLGFILNDQGISPSVDKVEAIQNFPTPKNQRQLQSFLGPVSYTHLDVYKRQILFYTSYPLILG